MWTSTIRPPASGRRRSGRRTFFPDDWSRQRVLDEIDGAWQNAKLDGDFWEGVSPSGLKIEGWLTGGGTAYPSWPQ